MSFFMSTYSMLSQRHETMTFKFALRFLNQIYKFSSLIILNPFIPRNVKRLLQTWKTGEMQTPPLFFKLVTTNSINQIFPSKREEAIVFFKTVLELLYSRRALICTSVVTPQCLLAGEHYSVPSTTAHVAGCWWDTVCTSKDGEKKYP